jgi:hypothetical protein
VPVSVRGYATPPAAQGSESIVREEPFRNGDAVIEMIAAL